MNFFFSKRKIFTFFFYIFYFLFFIILVCVFYNYVIKPLLMDHLISVHYHLLHLELNGGQHYKEISFKLSCVFFLFHDVTYLGLKM